MTPPDFSRELATVRLDDVTITPDDLRPDMGAPGIEIRPLRVLGLPR